MSPRPDVSNERKTQILNAAEDIFTQKGFDDARMEDIAEETGVSKGTLYLYFKSKNDLIFAILDRMFEREFKQFADLEKQPSSATETIWMITDMICKDIVGMIRLIPIVYQFLALAFRNKLVQAALKRYINYYLDILTPIVQRGIDSGEFKAVDAREVSIAMGAVIEGTLLLWVYDRTIIDPEKHIRSGMNFLMDGIQA
jgi:AcrR family transcriptional regulator